MTNGKDSPHATEQMIREPGALAKTLWYQCFQLTEHPSSMALHTRNHTSLSPSQLLAQQTVTQKISSNLSLGVPVAHLRCSNVVSRPQTPNVKPASNALKVNKTTARMDIPIQAP